MSIYQHSTDLQYNTFTWQQQQQQHLCNHQNDAVEDTTKEPLFEKPLTPSDVGKLNRLVIPKQHAERYFPNANANAERGLILCFEDEEGKLWRFRYSYWSSSQSYVLTKGWSRFVKENHLDAGDVVSFLRHRMDCRRLFIRWRRHGGEDGRAPPPPSPESYRRCPLQYYQPEYLPLDAGQTMVNQQIGTTKSKTLRLFGVDMECQLD